MSKERTASTDDSTVLMPPMPSRIGDYVLKQRIASGGMGTVYEAVQESTGKTVAVKMLIPAMASSSALRRFRTERKILAKLSHPNIARVYDAGIYDEGSGAVPYFVMEYIPDAQSITQYARTNELGTREKLKLFSTVCEAVHYGNQRGIIHRDLKPSNILVDSSGKVKVIDFGVARTTDSDLTATSQVTRSGELIGTLAYMSPEQVRGRIRYIDERSDVYSLGVVLYELFADRLPYDLEGLAEYEVLRAIQEQTPKRLSEVVPSVGDDLETLVHTALTKDRQWRYQSAEEFRQNIQRFLDQQPLVVPTPTLKHKVQTSTRTFIRRHPIVAYALAIIFSAIFGEVIGLRIANRWTFLDSWFTKTVVSQLQPVSLNQPLEHVRVIQMTEETVRKIDQIATSQGLAGVSAQHKKSWRRLHGRLMEKLAELGVRTVAYDVRFPGETEFDHDFVQGVMALNDAGIDVIIGVNYWGFEDGGRGGVSSNIARYVKWGCTIASPTERFWAFYVVAQRGGFDLFPGLSLTSAASYLQPRHEHVFRYDSDEYTVGIRYYKILDPQDPRAKEWINVQSQFQLTTEEIETETFTHAMQKNDVLGVLLIDLPSDLSLMESTLEYESLFEMDSDTLRSHLEGKLVMIGRAVPDFDIHPTPDGRLINGVHGHAVAIDALLRQQPIMSFRFSQVRVVYATSAILGALIGWIAVRRRITSIVILFFALIAAAVGSLFMYIEWQYIFNPFSAMITIILAFALATQINRFYPHYFNQENLP